MRKKICVKCGSIIDPTKGCRCKVMKIAKPKVNNNENLLFTYKWQKLRNKIKLRDGGYCQRCYHKFNKLTYTRLEIHHIKGRATEELMWDEDNLICICADCNKYFIGKAPALDFNWEKEKDEEIYL